MGINSMANAALARRPDYPPTGSTPKNIKERVSTAAKDPKPEDNQASEESAVSTALKTVTTYIPTEILTLYVALTATLAPLIPESEIRNTNFAPDYTSRWVIFGIFLLITPAAVWIAFVGKLTADRRMWPRTWSQLPKWEMIAASIAFIAWAAALPDSPFGSINYFNDAIAGAIVLITSTALAWLAGLFPQLQKTDPAS